MSCAQQERQVGIFCRELTRPPNWLYQVLSRKNGILIPTLREVADELGVSMGSLVDPPNASTEADYIPPQEFETVTVNMASAADEDRGTWDATVTGHLAFHRSWLVRHNVDPDRSSIITVSGKSMEPTLMEGDAILVDGSRDQPTEGRIYVVMLYGQGLVVKRAARDDQGEWEMVSDNPAWQAVPWPEDATVLGEVCWASRTLVEPVR